MTEHRLAALEALGIDPTSCQLEILSSSSPVFLAHHEGRRVVVKKTRSPLDRADALHRWTSHLERSGVSVVTPVSGLRTNPVEVGGEVWVAYPFVDGDPYAASPAQIRAAGRLLGAIHAVRYDGPELSSLTWEEADEASINADVRRMAEVLAAAEVADAEAVVERYEKALEGLSVDVATLSAADLVWCNGPWDYKANNLVYVDESHPVLIDPDLSGNLPRVLDLALAALLFHNELTSAPGRLFTEEEWSSFYAGYGEHIELSASEREVWPVALDYMRLDEGLWLVMNDPEGWHEPGQRKFLQDLLMSNLRHIRAI